MRYRYYLVGEIGREIHVGELDHEVKPPFVYGLFDPREPGHLRYVGMTMTDVKRPYDHQGWATTKKNAGENRHIANWVRKLHREGVAYSIVLIEKYPVESTRYFVYEREQDYIKVARANGHRLTNATDGGPGLHGYKFSDKSLTKMSIAQIGKKHTEETKIKMAVAQIGKKHTEQTKAKLSALYLGKKRNPEIGKKVSASLVGKPLSLAHRESLRGPRKPWSKERRAAVKDKFAIRRAEQMVKASGMAQLGVAQ